MANTSEIRYWFIELHAWWEGQINSPMLCREFKLSRQMAGQWLTKAASVFISGKKRSRK